MTMKLNATFAVLLAMADTALSFRTFQNPDPRPEYTSGQVHNDLMSLKMDRYAMRQQAGEYASAMYSNSTVSERVPCMDGYANEFQCSNFDLLYFATHADLGSAEGRGSSSWGWTAKDGREYIAIGQADGAAFAEVTPEGKLDYIGRLPQPDGVEPSAWRELRVMNDLVVIGSEAEGHHVQIFDMKKLLEVTEEEKPKTFHPLDDIESLFDQLPLGRTHNIVVNSELNYAVSVGSQPRNSRFKGGLVFIDLEDPKNPVLAGFQADDGYIHDAQCIIYKGPDTRYLGEDVCYGFNEDTLTIYNVTDKANGTIISRMSYEGAAYIHQGWVTDTENQEYLLIDDEYDEWDHTTFSSDGHAITYIIDIRDLENPTLSGHYKSAVRGIDHTQYTKDGLVYQSNYGTGLRVLDITSIPADPTGGGVKEIGFFDIYPEDDDLEDGGVVDFLGTWSSYGLFASGHVVINTIERGAFVVKYTGSDL